MENETTTAGMKDWCGPNWKHMHCHGCGSALYGLGFLGALVYYLLTATSLWTGFIGIIKAIIWPAVLVYGALRYMGL